jgi:hypothetical protein
MSLGMLALAAPALGQSGNASNSSSAGGSSASTGSSSSSASISTGGGGSVGVVQGAVSGGSTAGGSQSSGTGSGSGGSSQNSSSEAAATDEGANAAQDGIVSQLDLPAMGTVDDAIPASGMSSSVLILGLAAVFAVGLFVLYRKLPRAGATA